MKQIAWFLIIAGLLCIPSGYVVEWLSADRGPDGQIVQLVAGAGFGWVVAGYASAVVLVIVGLIMLQPNVKRCGNCGGELKVRSFMPTDDTCPHCGRSRHSMKTVATAIKVRFTLLGLAACLLLRFFLHVPEFLSIPLLFCPFTVWVWKYYQPFKESPPEAGQEKREDTP